MLIIDKSIPRVIVAVLLATALYFFLGGFGGLFDAGVKDDPVEMQISQILDGMSLRQKVGQMVQSDIRHIQPGDIEQYGLGSVLNGGGAFPEDNKYATLDDWRSLADAFYGESIRKTDGSAGIPVMWGTDAVHGNNNLIGATIFPHNIGLGAANDPALVRAIGQATALEVLAAGIDWAFAPTVAVVRDDRWGRTYEGYSDRPEIVESLGRELVLGLQGEGDDFLSDGHVLATAKHFIGDGGTRRGIDQGDNRLTKEALMAVHGQGYISAIDAGVQTVMASFNSWNGEKIHGRKDVLTGLLRDQLGFDGLLVSDWNGYGQVDGCDNEGCAQAINAGVDMLMSPEDWQALIENTIDQVETGEISEGRINEAVARILRVKIRAGLFEKGPPSTRIDRANDGVVGGEEHRALAREAVRKSLVLLKNNDKLLPLEPGQTFLVAGDGADDIGKQSGGWTISWQGAGNSNSDFPGATSIFAGIESAVREAGGKAYLSVDGQYAQEPDVAIVVFGEEPYAEGQGDARNLSFQQGLKSDLALLRRLKAKGIPVVSVLLSGRPLWVNAELNASDAFVVAWLPGSEGGGIADVILRDADGDPQYEFTGRLSFDWPAQEINAENPDLPVAEHLFDYGYGLTYQDNRWLANDLNEEPLLVANSLDQFVFKGASREPWIPYVGDESHWAKPVEANITESAFGELVVRTVDRLVQEDSRRLEWTGNGSRYSQFYWKSEESVDLTALRDINGALSLVVKVDKPPGGEVFLRMDCGYPCTGEMPVTSVFRSAQKGEWFRLNVPLSCLEESGTDLSRVNAPFLLITNHELSITVSEVSLLGGAPEEGLMVCTS